MLGVDLKGVVVLAPFGKACRLKRAQRVVLKFHHRHKAIIHICGEGCAIGGGAGGHPIFEVAHHRFRLSH